MKIGEFFENRLKKGSPKELKYEKDYDTESDILLQLDFKSDKFTTVPFEEILKIFGVSTGSWKKPTIVINKIEDLTVHFSYDYLRFRGVGKDDGWGKYEGIFDFSDLKILELKHEWE